MRHKATQFPLEVVDGLRALSGPNLAARKVLAILDRAEGRDFADLACPPEHTPCLRNFFELWSTELLQTDH